MPMPGEDRLLRGSRQELDTLGQELESLRAMPRRLDADPDKLERGLAQLVMTVVDLLRQLMERQALRRVESGTLTDEEVERLGLAFKRLSERMEELKETFGLRDEDLNLDLGPLGRLK
jgi:hypothetical protein